MISGVPAHVDGRMLGITEDAGARIVNRDRMWHYTEGIHNWDPIWPDHAIRIIPGPSSMWFDATGQRLRGAELPRLRQPRHAASRSSAPATTTRGSCSPSRSSRRSSRSRAPSRTPTSPARTSGSWLKSRLAKGAPGPVEAFKEHGEDFVVADTLRRPGRRHEQARPRPAARPGDIERQIVARDREVDNALLQGPPADGDRTTPAAPAPTGWSGSPSRTGSSTRSTAR